MQLKLSNIFATQENLSAFYSRIEDIEPLREDIRSGYTENALRKMITNFDVISKYLDYTEDEKNRLIDVISGGKDSVYLLVKKCMENVAVYYHDLPNKLLDSNGHYGVPDSLPNNATYLCTFDTNQHRLILELPNMAKGSKHADKLNFSSEGCFVETQNYAVYAVTQDNKHGYTEYATVDFDTFLNGIPVQDVYDVYCDTNNSPNGGNVYFVASDETFVQIPVSGYVKMSNIHQPQGRNSETIIYSSISEKEFKTVAKNGNGFKFHSMGVNDNGNMIARNATDNKTNYTHTVKPNVIRSIARNIPKNENLVMSCDFTSYGNNVQIKLPNSDITFVI